MSLDVGYSYCIGLSEEEKKIVDDKISKNRKQIRMLFLGVGYTIILLGKPAHAAPVPGADAFNISPYGRPRMRSQPSSAGDSTGPKPFSGRTAHQLKKKPIDPNSCSRGRRSMNDRYVPEYGATLEDPQIQRKFRHAPDFGVFGNPNRENFELFKDKIIEHMKDPSTISKDGTYKKIIEVVHYFNEKTGLNVMIRQNDNTFISGWKLNDQQLQNVKDRGTL